ncbi:MAG: hypothetical protein KAR00_00310 [Candidatus Pacebacteria bacterium]|nr:hypothetical protein [Candidatus Paceibacterota bacterium]
MSVVQFLDENEFDSRLKNCPKKYSGLVNLVIRIGLAKDEQSANKLLLLITVVLFALSIFVLFSFNQSPEPLSPQEIQSFQVIP